MSKECTICACATEIGISVSILDRMSFSYRLRASVRVYCPEAAADNSSTSFAASSRALFRPCPCVKSGKQLHHVQIRDISITATYAMCRYGVRGVSSECHNITQRCVRPVDRLPYGCTICLPAEIRRQACTNSPPGLCKIFRSVLPELQFTRLIWEISGLADPGENVLE